MDPGLVSPVSQSLRVKIIVRFDRWVLAEETARGSRERAFITTAECLKAVLFTLLRSKPTVFSKA